jgi:hypothetical protein
MKERVCAGEILFTQNGVILEATATDAANLGFTSNGCSFGFTFDLMYDPPLQKKVSKISSKVNRNELFLLEVFLLFDSSGNVTRSHFNAFHQIM